jgi:hypothetical protein
MKTDPVEYLEALAFVLRIMQFDCTASRSTRQGMRPMTDFQRINEFHTFQVTKQHQAPVILRYSRI